MSDIQHGELEALRRRGPGDSPGILLWRAANAWQRDIRIIVKANGLTQAQYVLLLGLSELAGRAGAAAPTTQRAVAAYCGVDATMASQVLRQLEGAGYLRRAPGVDARSRAVYLNPSGQRAVAEIAPAVGAADSKFFAVLGGNVEMFKAALQVLIGLPPRLGSARRTERARGG